MSSLTDFLGGTVSGNLGIAWPDLLLVIVVLCALIFFAMSFRIGLVASFIIFATTYIGFSEWGLPTLHAFTIFILTGVIMIASLFVSRGRAGSGVIG